MQSIVFRRNESRPRPVAGRAKSSSLASFLSRARALALLPLAFLPARAAAQDVGGIDVGARAPVIQAQDLAGKPAPLDAIGRTPALIEFWATWCPYCQRLEPRMKAVFQKYGRRVRFYAVAVNVNESPTRVSRYTSSHALPYTILYDASGEATRAYDVPATSFVVITDATGRVAYTGLGDGQDLDSALARVTEAPRTGRTTP